MLSRLSEVPQMKMFFLVDALDECEPQDDLGPIVDQFYGSLGSLASSSVSLADCGICSRGSLDKRQSYTSINSPTAIWRPTSAHACKNLKLSLI